MEVVRGRVRIRARVQPAAFGNSRLAFAGHRTRAPSPALLARRTEGVGWEEDLVLSVPLIDPGDAECISEARVERLRSQCTHYFLPLRSPEGHFPRPSGNAFIPPVLKHGSRSL